MHAQENGDSGEGSAPEPAGESAAELKAKLARLKRQALAFKAKAAEAAAARDVALQQLASLQVLPCISLLFFPPLSLASPVLHAHQWTLKGGAWGPKKGESE